MATATDVINDNSNRNIDWPIMDKLFEQFNVESVELNMDMRLCIFNTITTRGGDNKPEMYTASLGNGLRTGLQVLYRNVSRANQILPIT